MNNDFIELVDEERFSIKPNQICVVHMKFQESKIYVGHFVRVSESGNGFLFTELTRFDDYGGRKRWIGVLCRPHLYEMDVKNVIKFYIPKKDLSRDACMKLVLKMN
tara:strand:+ start:1135 stop:1452 length:318 start_codon:yes stop_codon:yes gene_type:complete